MRNGIQLMMLVFALSSCCSYGEVFAQSLNSDAALPLNSIRITQCGTPSELENWAVAERKKGAVIDSRPFAINQTTGKLSFNGGVGRISVMHMNPFVYDYRISVAQQELVSTAITDFLKLLLPQSLGSLPGLQSGEAGTPLKSIPADKLRQIESRLETFNSGECQTATAATLHPCSAGRAMYAVFDQIRASGFYVGNNRNSLSRSFGYLSAPTNALSTLGTASEGNSVFTDYTETVTKLRNEEADTHTTCKGAEDLNKKLNTYNFNTFFEALDNAQQEIKRVTGLANDLKELTVEYNKDDLLKQHVLRCSGFNCTNQFDKYATEVLKILGGYQRELDGLRTNGQEMQNMKVLTNQMKDKDGLFARTFTVIKKFELSEATVSIKRTKIDLKKQQEAAPVNTINTQSGTPDTSSGTTIPQPLVGGGSSSEGSVSPNPEVNNLTQPGLQSGKPSATPAPATAGTAPTGQINEVVQFGRPRFMLSGGLVFSPLPRRTFDKVKGFVLDAQGNPIGNGSANVAGFVQNSPRRLLPMVLLNSRLLDYDRGGLYFSFGISGKHDGNLDIEYLLGPSVSFLNDRALFTFGAYGGQSQNLVDDLRIGDELPDSLGDAKLYRKSLTWKPGFSFSYSFSRATKRAAVAPSGSGTPNPADDDLKSEFRIGSIPFNFALGLAYTSLEERTYDEIAGFARDRQGNLTNGRTLTRIVGLNSSSDYRLTPLALLHTRLTNFGAHDFYFSSGITGKKTDNDFDVEYLLGGSVNVFQRKVFLTVGTFIGKQQILGVNFFEGAALNTSQSVTTTNRYVWKPAISFSYDISRIIPRK